MSDKFVLTILDVCSVPAIVFLSCHSVVYAKLCLFNMVNKLWMSLSFTFSPYNELGQNYASCKSYISSLPNSFPVCIKRFCAAT